MRAQPRHELWVQCRPCGHVWIACYLPQPLGAIGRALRGLHCPKCLTGAGNIVLAAETNIPAGSGMSDRTPSRAPQRTPQRQPERPTRPKRDREPRRK